MSDFTSSMALEQRVANLLARIAALEAGGGGGGGAGFVDSSEVGSITAELTNEIRTIDYADTKPSLNLNSADPEFMLTLTAIPGGTSSPVVVIESIGTGNGASLEFMSAQGVGGTPTPTADGDILGNIYFVGLLDGGTTVVDSVTVTVMADDSYVANDGPASYEIKTKGRGAGKHPRFYIDFDGDTQILAGNLILESHAPAAADSVGKQGTITWDSGFIYICVATDTWVRAAIAAWP